MLNTLSIMQHHDAITGTHLIYVGDDYRKRMRDVRREQIELHEGIVRSRLEQALSIVGLKATSDFQECKLNGMQIDCEVNKAIGKYLKLLQTKSSS